MLNLKIFISAVLVAMPVYAQSQEYHASNGQIFFAEKNENGAKLTSKYPVSVYTEAGVASTFEEKLDVIYVGKSCDVYSARYGDGTWGWANGGFIIEFKNMNLGFPRQALDAGQGLGCQI